MIGLGLLHFGFQLLDMRFERERINAPVGERIGLLTHLTDEILNLVVFDRLRHRSPSMLAR
jgi:hypothetical protein